MIAIVILAAGSSKRLGRPKQLEEVGAESLLARAVRVAVGARLGAVFVVVGAADLSVIAEARRSGCEVVINEEAAEGMASSIRAGVRAIGDEVDGVIVMTCDQPAVTSEHLRLLAEGAEDEAVASAYGGRRGAPAWFPASRFGDLMKLRGDAGARELLRDVRAVALEGGETDVDTEEDLDRARMLFGVERVL